MELLWNSWENRYAKTYKSIKLNEVVFLLKDKERLEGEDIYLSLERTEGANPDKGYVPAYYFGIHRYTDDMKVGYCDLRVGHNENTKFGGNIGYAIDEEFRGHHYAGKAGLLLMDFAKEHEMTYLIITCHPENMASRKTCEFMGAKLLEIVDVPQWHEMYLDGRIYTCRYEIKL